MKNTKQNSVPKPQVQEQVLTQAETIQLIKQTIQQRDSVSDSSAIDLAQELSKFDSLSLGLVIAEMDSELIDSNKYLFKWKQLQKRKHAEA